MVITFTRKGARSPSGRRSNLCLVTSNTIATTNTRLYHHIDCFAPLAMTNKCRTNTLVCPYKTNPPIHVGTGFYVCQNWYACPSIFICILTLSSTIATKNTRQHRTIDCFAPLAMTNKRRTNTLICPYKTNPPIHAGTGWNPCQELGCLSVSIDLQTNPRSPPTHPAQCPGYTAGSGLPAGQSERL